MLFNSLTFLAFAAIVLPLFFMTRGSLRIWISLVSSYVFYGWWDWRFLGLIWFSTLLDFYLGKVIYRAKDSSRRKWIMAASIAVNLGFLGFFKYLNFFIASFQTMLAWAGVEVRPELLNIILPVGISFYTFQTMSYTIDIYRNRIQPEPSLLRFATFVAFFPQLVAGPIIRAETFLPQFDWDHNFNWKKFLSGLTQVLIGFFKKVAVADTLAIIVDRVYDQPDSFSGMMVLIACVFYAFQIYCDFSGYSDIAIGLARMMGFEFPENFRTPYFSKSFSEFWTRWHISLSSWLRDYLYIPLGGNRHGTFNQYRNLMLTMLLGGLWHGANWTFFIWGGLHGIYLVVQRIIATPFQKLTLHLPIFLNRAISVIVVFSLTTFAWIFFRSQNLSEAFLIISKIRSIHGFSVGDLTFLFPLVKGFILLAMVLALDLMILRVDLAEYFSGRPYKALAFYVVVIMCIAFLGTFDNQQFIYFQF